MKHKNILFVVGAMTIFSGLVAGVFVLVRTGVINTAVGLLMLISLLGMYVGFGILIAVYRLILKLE